MLTIEMTVDGMAALKQLDEFDRGQWARDVGDAIAEEQVLPFFRNYPSASGKTRKDVYGSSFVSDKQRRFFFAALRDEKIQVPYHRTDGIAANWEVSNTSLYTTRVRSKKSYAKYVVGEDTEQAAYHRGNWKTVTEVAAFVEQNTAQQIAEREIARAIQDAGLAP